MTARRLTIERLDRLIAAHDAAERAVARECRVPLAAVKCVSGVASATDGSRIHASGWNRRPRQPIGYGPAFKAGLVGEKLAFSVGPINVWSADITPEGRRVLWRLHEEIALAMEDE